MKGTNPVPLGRPTGFDRRWGTRWRSEKQAFNLNRERGFESAELDSKSFE